MTLKDVKVESTYRKYLKLKEFLARRRDKVNFKLELGKAFYYFKVLILRDSTEWTTSG